MRRFLMLLTTIALIGAWTDAEARGLYKGHGRRSADLWSTRLNLSGGIHGANSPLRGGHHHEWGWASVGGYAAAGLEVRSRDLASLEVFGGYRGVDDTDTYRAFPYGGGNLDAVRDHYQIDAFHAGVTLRKYLLTRRAESYFGVGGGVVRSESLNYEVVNGAETFRLETDDTGPELHFLVGWEGRFADPLSVGVEVGYRFAWLDDASDFTGAVLGLRLGLLLGR